MKISRTNMKNRIKAAKQFFRQNPQATIDSAYDVLKTNPKFNGIGMDRKTLRVIRNNVLQTTTQKTTTGIPTGGKSEETPLSSAKQLADGIQKLDATEPVETYLFDSGSVLHLIGSKKFVVDTLTKLA